MMAIKIIKIGLDMFLLSITNGEGVNQFLTNEPVNKKTLMSIARKNKIHQIDFISALREAEGNNEQIELPEIIKTNSQAPGIKMLQKYLQEIKKGKE